jgi:hypothetical protein
LHIVSCLYYFVGKFTFLTKINVWSMVERLTFIRRKNWLNSCPGYRLSPLMPFVVFLSPCRKCSHQSLGQMTTTYFEYSPTYQSTAIVEFDVQPPGITMSYVKLSTKWRDRDLTGTLAYMTPHFTVLIRRAVYIKLISLKHRKCTLNRPGVKKYKVTCTQKRGL